jgi:alkylated DNA repair dioxygenase AlkB
MKRTLFDIDAGINLLPFDGEALFYPDFLEASESKFFLDRLLSDYEFRQLPIHIYDMDVLQPKLTAMAGDISQETDYSENLIIQPWSSDLLRLKQKIEITANVVFTHALLNLYRDGKDSVGWHRDKERFWGKEPVIASLSLGAERLFQFRNYTDRKIIRNITLTPGSLLIMKGACQKSWEHRLPKSTKRIGPRLNITFRVLKSGGQ